MAKTTIIEDSGATNTGNKVYVWLYEVNSVTGVRTGRKKLNLISDPDYVAPTPSTECNI